MTKVSAVPAHVYMNGPSAGKPIPGTFWRGWVPYGPTIHASSEAEAKALALEAFNLLGYTQGVYQKEQDGTFHRAVGW